MPAAYPGSAGPPPPVDVLYCPGSTDWPEYRQPCWRRHEAKHQFAPLCLLDPIKVE